MSFPLDLLPKEVLHHIFSYLKVPDRLNASLVCKQWLNAMNSKSLLRDIKVLINDNNTVPIFVQMTRNFLNFSFSFIIVDNKYYALFKRISSTVEYLSFENCEIWKREPVEFDLSYDNLQVLKVFDCDLWTLFPCLPNLIGLYLRGNSTITDDGIAILQQSMKHLKTFSLDCYVSFDHKAYKRFYCHGDSYESSPSPLVLSFPAIKSFISERASTLKELRFNYTITSKALAEISSIKNLSLHKIDLASGSGGLIELFKNQPCLKLLHMARLANLNEDVIFALCALLPNIEDLDIYGCNMSSNSLTKVLQLKKLKRLNIGGFYNMSETGYMRAISDIECLNIQALNLSCMRFKNIHLLIAKCCCLVYLDLSCCNIEDSVLHFVSANLINLEHLSLKHNAITDYALTGVKIPEQDHIETEDSDEDILNMPLSNLKHLKKLKLNECEKITDHGLMEAVRFQYLEYLNICGCRIKRSTIETLLLQNPSIRNIYCDDEMKHPKVTLKKRKNAFHEDEYVFFN